MGVLDGQPVNQSITNAAFINKNQDDTMSNKLGFARTLSGATVSDIQAAVNKLYTATGASEIVSGTVYNATANTITNGDSYQTALTKVADKFDAVTGHMHTGNPGDGPILNVVYNVAASGSTGLHGSVVLAAGAGVSLNQVSQTITISATSTGGGGGGGSLSWVENYNSPTPVFENNLEVYSFDNGLSQALYTVIKVPSSYVGTSPIQMRTEFYSPDSTGTVLFQTVSTLIRTGTDAITSTTNQRTSTNSAITLGAGTVNIPQAIVLDLTDTSGAINSVAVSPNDTIIVQFYRGTDTGASPAKHMSFATEVTFS